MCQLSCSCGKKCMLYNWWLPTLCFMGVRARGTEHQEPVHMEGKIAQQGCLQTFWVRPPHTMPRQLSGVRFQVHLNWNSAEGLLGCLAGKGTVGWKGAHPGRRETTPTGLQGGREYRGYVSGGGDGNSLRKHLRLLAKHYKLQKRKTKSAYFVVGFLTVFCLFQGPSIWCPEAHWPLAPQRQSWSWQFWAFQRGTTAVGKKWLKPRKGRGAIANPGIDLSVHQ